MFKNFIKGVTPPIIQAKLRRHFLKKLGYFSGPYASWKHAQGKAAGYDDKLILEQVKNATLRVKDDRQLFVRDGVVFDTPQYGYPKLAAILRVALEHQQQLAILDFGGGLGSEYFTFKSFYPQPLALNWMVVEQTAQAECGNQCFANEELRFFDSVLQLPTRPMIALLSGALQYIHDKDELLDQLLALNIPYLLLDRTWFSESSIKDQIFIEHVPSHIYQSSYPCWVLSYSKLKKRLLQQYDVLSEFDAPEGKLDANGTVIVSKGLFLKRKGLE